MIRPAALPGLERWRLAAAVLVLHAALLASAGCKAKPVARQPVVFAAVAPGIEHAAFDVTFDLSAEGGSSHELVGHAFRLDLHKAALHLVPAGSDSSRRTVDQIAAGPAVVVATNASFFDEDGRALGLGVDDGRLLAMNRQAKWGALVVDGDQARIVAGADVRDDLTHGLVVQGIPRLVVQGVVPKLKPQEAERTALCAHGSTVILVVTGRVETTAFARFLADPAAKGGLGCVDALNLDGGPSTQLYARGKGLSLDLKGGWGVPNALVATPR